MSNQEDTKSYKKLIEAQIIELNKTKENAKSLLTPHQFLNQISNFDDKQTKDYWSVFMKSYDENGEWMGGQYKLLTVGKSITLDDFLVHYTSKFHNDLFFKRIHSYSNKIYLSDNTNLRADVQLIAIILK